jgi:hypothetical protein
MNDWVRPNARKFLAVCHGGNNRSAALTRILHDEMGQEAVPIGWSRHTEQSLNHFCEWADYVIAMTAEIATHIPMKFKDKIRVVDVGEDTYGNPYHAVLTASLRSIVREWQQQEFRI